MSRRGVPIGAGTNIAVSGTVRRVFTGPTALPAEGNPCELRIVQHESEAFPAAAAATQCFTWPLDEHRAAVQCFTSDGHRIDCCGHGLIASADWWSERWPGDGFLLMGGTEHPCRNRDDLSWVGFERLALKSVEAPGWLRDLLSPHRLELCYIAGPEDGYLVAELAGDSDLTTLAPPGAALAVESARALLVFTAVERLSLAGETLHFRYFAPQYGTPEDPATGSAMRLLGELSGNGSTVLQAVQRSPQGGLLFAHRDDDFTWVGGRVDANGPAMERLD